MYQIKIFDGFSIKTIQTEIDKWCEENKDKIIIRDISSSMTETVYSTHYLITILYN